MSGFQEDYKNVNVSVLKLKKNIRIFEDFLYKIKYDCNDRENFRFKIRWAISFNLYNIFMNRIKSIELTTWILD